MATNNTMNPSSIWYSFTKEELNGGRRPDEIKHENAQRRQICAFLQDAGILMRLPQLTIATAIVFFHRFFARHSFKEYDKFIVGVTCLFLAGKVEETPKKLREVLEVTTRLKNKDNPNFVLDPEEYKRLRELVLYNEFIVLKTIGFDLTVEHAYRHLLTYVKGISGDKQLAQVAWNFVNDSLRTTLCLQFKPQLIACAAIYLASKFLKYEIPVDKKPWWEVFDPNTKKETLEEISSQILDLYESSPNVEAIKSNSGPKYLSVTSNIESGKREKSQPSAQSSSESSSIPDEKGQPPQISKPPTSPRQPPPSQPPPPRTSPSGTSHRSSPRSHHRSPSHGYSQQQRSDYRSGSRDFSQRSSRDQSSRSFQRSPGRYKRHHPYNT